MLSMACAEWNRQGITREVILTRRYAIKIPKLACGWKHFLWGLLANMQERTLSKAGWPELCPVVFSLPGGWLLVMRRAGILTDADWASFNAKAFCETPNYFVPAEQWKQDSFGKIDGRIVAVDYGSC
jgi:hypothetical protein